MIWKDIKGYEGRYQVSDTGLVKSLGNDRTRKEKMLKPRSCGYKLTVSYTHLTLPTNREV